jgi:hypothetical protein
MHQQDFKRAFALAEHEDTGASASSHAQELSRSPRPFHGGMNALERELPL